jgi:hypothetical protein
MSYNKQRGKRRDQTPSSFHYVSTMDSTGYPFDEAFPDELAQCMGLNSFPTDDIYRSELPPIPEVVEEQIEGWDSGLGLDWQGLFDQQPGYDIANHTPMIQTPTETQTAPPQVLSELSDLEEQVKELRRAIMELQSTVCARLDSIEKSVSITEGYVSKMVAWSFEVQKSYGKLLDVMSSSRQADKASKVIN